jgi:hypothetical protein
MFSRVSLRRCALTNRVRAFLDLCVLKKRRCAAFMTRLNLLSRYVSVSHVTICQAGREQVS